MANHIQSIAIVGAGLIGRLSALALKRAGFTVTLFDKDKPDGKQSAAYAAAGLLTPLGESLHCDRRIVEMGFASLKLWPEILKTLDGYHFFQQLGTLMVSHEQDQGDYLRFVRHLNTHYCDYQKHQLNRSQILELEPELGRSFNQGLFLPDEGQIGNRKLLIALEQQLNSEGIEWLSEHQVDEIHTSERSAQILCKGKSWSFDLAIDCRGFGASKKLTQSHALTDLRAVRGELFQLFAPDVNITRPIRLMHPRYQLYIAPKTKGFYVVGATEIESDDIAPMTVRSSMELLSAAYSVHPGFAEANIRQHVSQLRPAFSDNQPQVIVNQRLIQVNGLYRHGYLIAPTVIKQVEQLTQSLAQNNNNKMSELELNAASFTQLLPIKVFS